MITQKQRSDLAAAVIKFGAARANMHLVEGKEAQAAADRAADDTFAAVLGILNGLTDWSAPDEEAAP